MILSMAFSLVINASAIDNGRSDLGMLDSLKISDQFGSVIDTDGAQMRAGYVYTLLYEWSLDDPSADYQNKVATFDLPSVFEATTVSPTSIPLYYDDNGTDVQIGTVSVNSGTGTVTVQFNNSPVLGAKSNIHGWISLSATSGSTLGTTDITIGWNGSNEDKISVNVIEEGVGDNHPAVLNKYVRSGMMGNQPIVQQDANGKFFVTFSVEVLLSKPYSDLTIKDTVYSGMTVDPSSIKVLSRPRDGSVYYSTANPNVYKNNYDLWQAQNPSGPLLPNNDVTASLLSSNAIVTSGNGFEVNLGSVDFNDTLASRQLTTTPLQLRYRVDYNVFLTAVNPTGTLAEAQSTFESQMAKNEVSFIGDGTVVTETAWNKGVLGGGAVGETRDVTLKKVDKNTGASLAGATFDLYKQNAYDASLWELYKGNINMTNPEIVVDGLTFGTYRFEETKAPEGYVLPTTAFDAFTIDGATPVTNFEVTLENLKATGDLAFEKVDSVDPSIKLSATFEIYKKSNNERVQTVTTGLDGIGSVPNLDPGAYYLVETMAPENYKLDATPHDFTITEGEINSIFVGNNAITNEKAETPKSEDPKGEDPKGETSKTETSEAVNNSTAPQTGDSSNLIMLSMVLLGSVSVLIGMQRKKQRKTDTK